MPTKPSSRPTRSRPARYRVEYFTDQMEAGYMPWRVRSVHDPRVIGALRFCTRTLARRACAKLNQTPPRTKR